MNRSGIPTLNAGAYDNLPGSSLRLSGDQRPTYTQRRRTQMAGGGIMGSNAGSMLVAPTADGSRPGYADWWNPLTWGEPIIDVAKKVGQTIIPGGETGYFDLYGGAGDVAKTVGETIIPGGETGYFNLYGEDPNDYWESGDETTTGGQKISWKRPMAIGATAGLAQKKYLADQPKFPGDETDIQFQTAQEAMDDPNLRFKPKAQYADVRAQGGRIGYAGGSTWREFLEDKTVRPNPDDKSWKDVYYRWLDQQKNKAQGGRIGYRFGPGPVMAQAGLPGIPRMAPDGMEYDMSQNGGFQPLGAKEGKDDVKANLAKNEFVFTADAVRGAGNGDIELGAQKMYDTMKNLERRVG